MKFFTVVLTSILVLFSSFILAGEVSIVNAQSPNYLLNNHQSVTAVMPVMPTKKWNLVYQLTPTTPVTAGIQYQPELHAFVTEDMIMKQPVLKLATAQVPMASDSAEITSEATIAEKPIVATPAASVITIDKSEGETATTAAETLQKPSIKPVVTPEALPVSELDSLFDKYAAEYGLSANVLKHIAKCESGLRPEALSSNGLYGGLYQFVASTWSGNRKAMGLDPDPQLRFNAEEAIKTAAFKMSRDGYGAWPVCGKRAVAAAI